MQGSTGAAPGPPSRCHRQAGGIPRRLAVSLAIGGDCLADIAQLRAEPAVFGQGGFRPDGVPADRHPRGGRTRGAQAIDTARAAARARAWKLAGSAAPNHERSARTPLVVDVDATLVTAHSEKEWPHLLLFTDHGAGGTGEPLADAAAPGQRGIRS